MVYRGQIKNGVVVFEENINLPEGTMVRIEPIASSDQMSLAEQLADFIGCVSDLPPDMAEQHDHYIHGTPRR
ncbi:MAG TPA: hypothetical protein VHZ24_21275 [Pirellulales bacterium]|jgi:hypothetical protein|nr:hypothetical protein [Pirellulales bacterium]